MLSSISRILTAGNNAPLIPPQHSTRVPYRRPSICYPVSLEMKLNDRQHQHPGAMNRQL